MPAQMSGAAKMPLQDTAIHHRRAADARRVRAATAHGGSKAGGLVFGAVL